VPTITYRIATPDDTEALGHLRWEMEAERTENPPEHNAYLEAYVRDVKPAFTSGLYRAWLAEADGEPVACTVLITWIMPPTTDQMHRKRGYVSSVFTRLGYRRQGIARHLMDRLISSAREEGVQKLLLRASEMGEPLYLGMGFEHSGALEMELE